MEQGEIWWACLPLPSGRRPVVILTRSRIIPRLTDITIAPLTRSSRPIPTHVEITRRDGIPVDSVANLDNIQTVSKSLLDQKIVRLRSDRFDEILAAIRAAFDMPN
jgi:mRNA interferase MazF